MMDITYPSILDRYGVASGFTGGCVFRLRFGRDFYLVAGLHFFNVSGDRFDCRSYCGRCVDLRNVVRGQLGDLGIKVL